MRFQEHQNGKVVTASPKFLVGIVSIVLLSGCGGGGGSTPPAGISAHYAIRDLGTFLPHKITGNAKILGYLSSPLPYRPAIWQDGVATPFDAQGGTAEDLSLSGIVAGSVDKGTKMQAATFTNGQARPIVLPANHSSNALAINNLAMAAGVFTTSESAGSLPIDHAFVAAHGSASELPPLSGYTSAKAYAINDSGTVAGYASKGTASALDFTRRAILWSGGAPKDLNVFHGSKNAQAIAISNSGSVAGLADTYTGSLASPDKAHISFLWKAGISTELRPLAAGQMATVEGINTAGVCVGVSAQYVELHAVAWSGEDAVDLQSRIPPGSGWSLQSAASINDAGEIVGVGMHNGMLSGFLLTPQ